MPSTGSLDWSRYQEDVFDFVLKGKGSAVISAVAGAAKTTTIVETARRIPRNKTKLFLAFNKSIVEELVKKMPGTNVKTFHAIGMAAWSKYCTSKLNVDKNKVKTLIARLCDASEQKAYGQFVQRLVGIAKNMGVGAILPDTVDNYAYLIQHHGLYIPHPSFEPDPRTNDMCKRAVEIARNVIDESNKESEFGRIDFDDMLYMPVKKELKIPTCDFVMVDEAQDLNPIQHRMLLSMKQASPSTRFLFVGDRNQAIYGFRGADDASIDNLGKMFGCAEMPLSISYRCCKAVVAEAKKIVPEIEPWEHAPVGRVYGMTSAKFLAANEITPQNPYGPFCEDVVVCRNVAPLVSLAYQLIRRKVPCRVAGREIEEDLVRLIKLMMPRQKQARNEMTVDELKDRLKDHLAAMLEKFKDDEASAERVADQVGCVLALADNETIETIDDIFAALREMFADGDPTPKLVMSSAHKSKGLEWNRVFVLDREKYMPSPFARKPWQKKQEKNLEYVAYTRAKRELVFLTMRVGPGKESAKDSDKESVVEDSEEDRSEKDGSEEDRFEGDDCSVRPEEASEDVGEVQQSLVGLGI